MGGQVAVRGFEYQFLVTLEYALSAIASRDIDATVQVEGVLTADLRADQEIVDFALSSENRLRAVAQVKSGSPRNAVTASEMLQMLVRLTSHPSEEHLVVTNRPASPNLHTLLGYMWSGDEEIREQILSLVAGTRIANDIATEKDVFWERLRNTHVVLDSRDIQQVRSDVQDQIRSVRHRREPSTIGWDATGLLTGYLVWEVMGRAAGPQGPQLTMTDLLDILRMDADALKALMPERDWAVHVTPAPRATDIARPEVMRSMADCLSFPVHRDAAPVCLLAGLSGVGKSSLATAWADENAYAYGAIMWIDATSQSQVSASFTTIAEWLQSKGLLAEGKASWPVRERVFAALARSSQAWLMVFDNCCDQSLVREWIPPRGSGHIIVTSTDQSTLSGSSAAKIAVSGMTSTEATQLLGRRLLGVCQPNDADYGSLEQLAARLYYWPLALELASAYIASTLLEHTDDLAAGIANFERLLKRAMADHPSVPLSYPHTVVGAIMLTWQRVVEGTDPARNLAAKALRSAAFLASRRIPLHLVLACWENDLDLTNGERSVIGLPAYGGGDPPPGEVIRALKRHSLVVLDDWFPMPSRCLGGSTEALETTVAMNDIVQFIIRDLVDREKATAEVMFRTTSCTQAWLQSFSGNHEMSQAVAMAGHAIALSEHAIELDVISRSTALLWGNTAGILGYLDDWRGATRYLSAEASYLETVEGYDIPLLRAQTLASLAQALHQIADNPRDAVDRIVPCLENFVRDIAEAVELHAEATAYAVRSASSTVVNLRSDNVEHPKLASLESTLGDFRRMVPILEEVDLFDELTQLNEMLKNDQERQAGSRAQAILDSMTPEQAEFFQVLRVIAESHVSCGNWRDAREVVLQFSESAREGRLPRFDTTMLVRNIGIRCLAAMLNQEDSAFGLFSAIMDIADIGRDNGMVMQQGNRDIIAVFHALRAYFEAEDVTCANWLSGVDVDEISSVKMSGMASPTYQLLNNWCAGKVSSSRASVAFEPPERVMEQVFGHSTRPVSETVLPINEESVTSGLVNLGADAAPPRAVVSVQVLHAAGQHPRPPMEVAVETGLALRILGLPTEIAEVCLHILRDGEDVKWTDPKRLSMDNPANAHVCRVPHHVPWVTSSGHLADAVVPQLYAVRAVATSRSSLRHPVVVPFHSEEVFPVLRREGLVIAYNHLGTYDVHDLAKTLPSDRREACHANSFVVALKAVSALAVTGEQYSSEIESIHEELTGVVSRLARFGNRIR